jgi:hypothetical protein
MVSDLHFRPSDQISTDHNVSAIQIITTYTMSAHYNDETMATEFEWAPAGSRLGDDGAPIPIPDSAKCISLGCPVSFPGTIYRD